MVRVNFRVPVRVSHQGIVVRKGSKLYMRHAADRMYHSVVDEPLRVFMAYCSIQKMASPWYQFIRSNGRMEQRSGTRDLIGTIPDRL